MTIYTSYFAKIKQLPEHIVPVSICGKAPEWYKGLQYKKLAPKWDFFAKWKETHDNDYYIDCFNKQVLSNLNAWLVIKDIISLMNLADFPDLKDMCLVCYEKPSDFCHRHLVADWLNKNGIECIEYEFDDTMGVQTGREQ